MAISIVNITTAALTNAAFTATIPATTAGSLLVVAVTTTSSSGPANTVNHVEDNVQSFPVYSVTASGTRANDSGIGRTTNVFYRPNVQAGITQVLVVPSGGSGMNMQVVIYEIAGADPGFPLDQNTVRSATEGSTTSTSGTPITTTFTNAFFVGMGNPSAIQWGSGILLNSWVTDYKGAVGSNTWIIGHIIGSGTQTTVVSHASTGAAFIIATADFKPYVPSTTGMITMFNL